MRLKVPQNRPRTKEQVLQQTLRIFIHQYRRGEIDKTELDTRGTQALEKHYTNVVTDINQFFTSKGLNVELIKLDNELGQIIREWREILEDLP